MIQWAIVAHLASGLYATHSKRGRVDWGDFGETRDLVVKIRSGLAAGHAGAYVKPGYDLYANALAVEHGVIREGALDLVVAVSMVPQGEWRAAQHHTIPSPPRGLLR